MVQALSTPVLMVHHFWLALHRIMIHGVMIILMIIVVVMIIITESPTTQNDLVRSKSSAFDCHKIETVVIFSISTMTCEKAAQLLILTELKQLFLIHIVTGEGTTQLLILTELKLLGFSFLSPFHYLYTNWRNHSRPVNFNRIETVVVAAVVLFTCGVDKGQLSY